MSDCEAYRFIPCPFCGSEIVHIESWAKSFDPPQLWHEWHHADDDFTCYIRAKGKIVGSANADPASHELEIRRWNRRFI